MRKYPKLVFALSFILAGTVAGRAALAQQTATSPAPQQQDGQQQSGQQGQPAPQGTVLFHRNDALPDEPPPDAKAGDAKHPALKTRMQDRPPATSSAAQDAPAGTADHAVQAPAAHAEKPIAPPVTDTERSSLTFTTYNLDVRLVPAETSLAVRAKIAVRNDGAAPLSRLALQISSSLRWTAILLKGRPLAFQTEKLDSDVDHTGELEEAVVTLPEPLAPRGLLALDVIYSGTIPVDADRLERIGAPPDAALPAEWDRVSEEFTGLRGFGNVVWHPVASAPLALGDGARLFIGIGEWKLRQAAADMAMHVQVEYKGEPPAIAVLDGKVVPLKPAAGIPAGHSREMQRTQAETSSSSSSAVPAEAAPPVEPGPGVSGDPSIPRIASFEMPAGKLGFQAPSLFLFSGSQTESLQTESPQTGSPQTGSPQTGSSGVRIYFRNEDAGAAQAYLAAAALAQPLFQEWFGAHQMRTLNLVDLPEAADQPFETSNTLLLPLTPGQPAQLAPLFSHSLTHGWFASARPWMDEGLAQFMSVLWTERTNGRSTALRQLEAQRSALALAEPESPQTDLGESLIAASDDVYYRTKAAYVWWMLRDVAGEKPLQTALRQYRADQDTEPGYFQHLLEAASEKDLAWFFNDWVYHDLGLPDLSIAAVVPREIEGKDEFLVAVEVANDGYAAAEVPVTIHSGAVSITQKLLIAGRQHATTRILIEGHPDLVTVNDGSVPESRVTIHRKEIEITQEK